MSDDNEEDFRPQKHKRRKLQPRLHDTSHEDLLVPTDGTETVTEEPVHDLTTTMTTGPQAATITYMSLRVRQTVTTSIPHSPNVSNSDVASNVSGSESDDYCDDHFLHSICLHTCRVCC